MFARVRTSRGRGDGARGMGLLELLIALVIAVVVIAAVVRLTGTSQQAFQSVSQDVEANYDLRRAGERVADELRQSGTGQMSIDHSRAEGDVVTYQVPVAMAAEAIVWGAPGHPGWRQLFLVENGDLIRRLVDDTMSSAGMDEVLARDLTSAGGGLKVFEVTTDGTLVTITIRVPVTSEGETRYKEIQTSVWVRNS